MLAPESHGVGYAGVPLEPTLVGGGGGGGQGQKFTKKGGKILGRLHLPNRMVHLHTGCGDYPDKT